MDTQLENQSTTKFNELKAYSDPKLVEYGSLNNLTMAESGPKDDFDEGSQPF